MTCYKTNSQSDLTTNQKIQNSFAPLLLFFFQLVFIGAEAQFQKMFDLGDVQSQAIGQPTGSLITDGTYLYGMAQYGGQYNLGVVFKIRPDGTEFTKILDFDSSNGKFPLGSLIYDGTFLYGMTSQGGNFDHGVVFRVKPDGTNFTKLNDFNNNVTEAAAAGLMGQNPRGSLLLDPISKKTLYGLIADGGYKGYGSLFKINTDGSAFEIIFFFDDGSNGGFPNGSLISDGVFLYGMTNSGGAKGYGVIFKVATDGNDFSVLLSLDNQQTGSYPYGDLFLSGNYLYAMTSGGGTNGFGTVLKIKTDGTDYSKLFDFDGKNSGASPYGSLISEDGVFLYGLTFYGGVNGLGVIFRIKSDGTSFTRLYDFKRADGSFPQGTLYSDGINLYGMTQKGGANDMGSIFKFSNPLSLITQPTGQQTCEGDVVTLSTEATGSTKMNYLWQKHDPASGEYTDLTNTGTYSGVATSSLTINTAGNLGSGNYRCKVSGDLASPVYSQVASLVVKAIPAAPETKGASGCQSSSVMLTASASSDGSYRWYTLPDGGKPIEGQVSSTFQTPPLKETTTYYVSMTNGVCESARTAVVASIDNCSPPVIHSQVLSTQVGGTITVDLLPLIQASHLNIASLQVVSSLVSGASATINENGTLTLDYKDNTFAGKERITIKACDFNGLCSVKDFTIEVMGDIIVYNGVSPNGANPKLIIQYIDTFADTKQNTVYIFDRWENLVWHVSNYDNATVAFTGLSDSGQELPSGVYFYKIDFSSGRKSKTGFISLKR
jgi:gliding motility-associated-like protein